MDPSPVVIHHSYQFEFHINVPMRGGSMSTRSRGSEQPVSDAPPTQTEASDRRESDASQPLSPQTFSSTQHPSSRRQRMADIARRRAALFATWEEGSQHLVESVHAGGSEARRLGPWSSAVELANGREKELRKRQQGIEKKKTVGGGRKGKRTTWVPKRDPKMGPRRKDRVPRLAEMCIRLIAEMLDEVETLWGLPEDFKVRIAMEACERRALTSDRAHLFTENAPIEIRLPDCSALDASRLVEVMLLGATPRLQIISLGLCGRGMNDVTAIRLAREGALHGLKHLHLGGAYKLTDEGVAALCKAAPALLELALPRCSRVLGSSIEKLPLLLPDLRHLDLTEMAGLCEDTIVMALRGLPCLQKVFLDGIPEATDRALLALSDRNHGLSDPQRPGLECLSLRRCHSITSHGLLAVAHAHPSLRTLFLDECHHLSSRCLQDLAQNCTQLENLSMKRCSNAVEDTVVEKFAASEKLRRICLNACDKVSSTAIESLATHCKKTLEEVDVSWCRHVESTSLGVLADSCPLLQRLVVWGCSQIDDTFLLGHSNDALEIVGRGEELLPVL